MAAPPPRDLGAGPRVLIPELARHVGEDAVADWCVALLGGADGCQHPDWLPYFGGRAWDLPRRDPHTPWTRVWAARALRYAWRPRAAAAVVAALADPAWRVAEQAMHLVGQREIAEGADGVAALADHRLPRIRRACARSLGLTGDTEHVPVVLRLRHDPDPSVRDAARRAGQRLEARLDITLDGWSAD